jgi:hypothetical protein
MNAGQVKRLRLTAKIWSILSIGFVLLIFIGEMINATGPAPTLDEWLGLAFFPMGVVIGLILAWWHEGVGGAVTVLSFVAFYIWELILSGSLADGPFFLLVAAPGFLFLTTWLQSRRQSELPSKLV